MLLRSRVPSPMEHLDPAARAGGLRAIGSLLLFAAVFLMTIAVDLAGATTPTFYWGNPKPQGNELSALAFENEHLGYAVGLEGTCLVTTDSGATWSDRTSFSSFSADLKGVIIIGPGHLLAVGSAPGIFGSTDGGSSWAAVPNPSTSTLTNIARVGGSILSAIGDGGEILRSTDNGAAWQMEPPPVAGASLKDQYWRSPTDGYVLGTDVLRHTTNGGATWATIPGTQESAVFFGGDIRFLDAMNGWIMVDLTTYRTTDGGSTWFEKNGQFGQGPIYQSESAIVDASTRYVVTDAEGADVWKTVDDGLHWTLLYRRGNTRGYTDITSVNGALVAVSSDGDLIRSVDGGATWSDFTRSPGDGERTPLAALALLPNGVGFAAGGSTLLRTTDGGTNWAFAPGVPAIGGMSVLEFHDASFGLAAGNGGGRSEIARTTNGGDSWVTFSIDPQYVGYVVDADIVDPSVCFVALYGGTNIDYVYGSTDGGQSWTRKSAGVPTTVRLFTIDFLDAQTGYVGGGDFSAPRIYRTTDGGGQWTSVNTTGIGGSEIEDMHWFDSQTGLAASFAGIYRTTNGGQGWTIVQSGETGSLSFADARVGYACGPFAPTVQRTTDGGITWETIDLPWPMGPSVIHATPDGFLVAGSASVILGGRILDPASVENGEADGSEIGMWGSLGPGVRVRSAATSALSPLAVLVDASQAADRHIAPTGWVADVRGRRMAELAVHPAGPSMWRLSWEAPRGRTSSGVYFAVLDRGDHRASLKRILLK